MTMALIITQTKLKCYYWMLTVLIEEDPVSRTVNCMSFYSSHLITKLLTLTEYPESETGTNQEMPLRRADQSIDVMESRLLT